MSATRGPSDVDMMHENSGAFYQNVSLGTYYEESSGSIPRTLNISGDPARSCTSLTGTTSKNVNCLHYRSLPLFNLVASAAQLVYSQQRGQP